MKTTKTTVDTRNYLAILGSLLKKIQDAGFLLHVFRTENRVDWLDGTDRQRRQRLKTLIASEKLGFLVVLNSDSISRNLTINLKTKGIVTTKSTDEDLVAVVKEFRKKQK